MLHRITVEPRGRALQGAAGAHPGEGPGHAQARQVQDLELATPQLAADAPGREEGDAEALEHGGLDGFRVPEHEVRVPVGQGAVRLPERRVHHRAGAGARFTAQDGDRREVRHRAHAADGSGRLRRAHRKQLIRQEQLQAEPRRAAEPFDHAQREAPPAHPVQHLARVPGLQVDGSGPLRALESGQERGQHIGGEGGARAELEGPRGPFRRGEAGGGFLEQAVHAVGHVQEGAAGGREVDAVGMPREQRPPGRPLQLAHLGRHGGLGKAQAAGRLGDAPRQGHRPEGLQAAGIQRESHLKS